MEIVNFYEDKLQKKLVEYRRDLHENPELSMKEYRTTNQIKKWLHEEDITILDFGMKVGVVAEIKGELPGPTIAIRADIDALPIEEQLDIEFKSKNNGVMHACGHDLHTASILGASIILNKRKKELKGTIRVIFQPSEENAGGAEYVYNHGALNDVKAIFGFHNRPNIPVGTIGIGEGRIMASVDRFEIGINGHGGHAGMPNNCIDPILIASEIVSSVQNIVSRKLSSFDNAVISITRLKSGNTWNVIPDKAELEGTVRTFQDEARNIIPKLIKQTAEGIASIYGAKMDLRWNSYVPAVNNDSQFTKTMVEVANELGYNVVDAEKVPGGEDFAFYQSKIPGFFVFIGVDGTEEWHNSSFNLKEEALSVGAKYFSSLCINILDTWN